MKINAFLKPFFYFIIMMKLLNLNTLKAMDTYSDLDLFPELSDNQNRISELYDFFPGLLTVDHFVKGEDLASTSKEITWYSNLHIDLIKILKEKEDDNDTTSLSPQFFRDSFTYHYTKKRYKEAAFCSIELLNWLKYVEEAPTQNDYQKAAQVHYDLWREKKQETDLKKANEYLGKSIRLLEDTTPEGLVDLRQSINSDLASLEAKNQSMQPARKEISASRPPQNIIVTKTPNRTPAQNTIRVHVPTSIQKTGTLLYKRDLTGNILTLKQIENIIIKDDPIEKKSFIKPLFIVDETQTTYIAFDPFNKITMSVGKNTQKKTILIHESTYFFLELMKKFDVVFMDKLEDKCVYFESINKTIKIEGVPYPLAKIIL